MKALLACTSLALGIFAVQPALAATRQVGPGKAYGKPCAAFAAAQANDVIEIDAAGSASYAGDVCAVAADGLTIRGVNGRPHIAAAGQSAQGKAIWVVQGDDTIVENIEFSGAAVPDHNGAGIRAEGTNLTIRRCYFHDSQQGILGGAGEVLIENSEFARNGNCDDPAGCAHNMYISGSVTKFTLRYSYSHDVSEGHLVKSRARENYILYNRLTSENSTASYEINLPNAGTSVVLGNLIQQGPNTGNSALLDYGSEGASNPGKDLYVINNTFVNDRSAGGTFVSIAASVSTPAVVRNNIFAGPGSQVSQATAVRDHNFAGDPLFVNAGAFDYHLKPGSPCANAGVSPGSTAGAFVLTPVSEYVHPTSFAQRPLSGALDIGAYELAGGGSGGSGGTAGAAGAGGSAGTGAGVGGSAGAGTGGSAAGAGGKAGAGGSAAGAGGKVGAGGSAAGAGGSAGAGTGGSAGAGGSSGSSGGGSDGGCSYAASRHGTGSVLAMLGGLMLLLARPRPRRVDHTRR